MSIHLNLWGLIMRKFYKYRDFDDENMEKIIRNSSLYFSPIENFNDPFDCKLSYKQNYTNQEIQNYIVSLKERKSDTPHRIKDLKKSFGKKHDFIKSQNSMKEQIIASMGVLSLSSNYDNILMWSHYSKNHKGLVFEFTPRTPQGIGDCFFPLLEVKYSESYEELSYVNDIILEAQKLMLTKYKDWAYEEEYRCISLDYQGEKPFYKDELTSIIFGAKATIGNINKIKKLCHEHDFHHVEFKQAVLEHGSFALTFKNV